MGIVVVLRITGSIDVRAYCWIVCRIIVIIVIAVKDICLRVVMILVYISCRVSPRMEEVILLVGKGFVK